MNKEIICCFAAHGLSLRRCHSSAQGPAVFPEVFLPEAPVNKHQGTFHQDHHHRLVKKKNIPSHNNYRCQTEYETLRMIYVLDNTSVREGV